MKKDRNVFQLDVLGIMESYTPEIFHFISPEELVPIISKKLTIKLSKRLQESLALGHSKGFDAYDDGDFYDLLYLTTKLNDPNSEQFFVENMVALLRSYNYLFGTLNIFLSPEQKLLLKDTVLKIFRNANNQYAHYIGELFVLYVLLNSGYKLKSVSHKFGAAKDAEFLVSKNGVDRLYEVYNVRITTSKSISLKRKIQSKMNDKLSRGTDDTIEFFLQPFVWSKSIATIIALAKEATSKATFKIDNVCDPLSLFMFRPDNIPTCKLVDFTEITRYY